MPLDRHRQNDSNGGGGVQITRSIPLPYVIGVVIAIAGQAASVYYAQQQQGERIRDLIGEIRTLTTTIASANVKDVEHDFRLADHDRRIQVLEIKEKGSK